MRLPGADLGQVAETVTRGLGPPLPFAPGSLCGLMVGLPTLAGRCGMRQGNRGCALGYVK